MASVTRSAHPSLRCSSQSQAWAAPSAAPARRACSVEWGGMVGALLSLVHRLLLRGDGPAGQRCCGPAGQHQKRLAVAVHANDRMSQCNPAAANCCSQSTGWAHMFWKAANFSPSPNSRSLMDCVSGAKGGAQRWGLPSIRAASSMCCLGGSAQQPGLFEMVWT